MKNIKLLENLEREFIEWVGEGEVRCFFAPSRINIIGEHIDYNGGRVLPCAIEIGTFAAVRPNDSGTIRLKSLNLPYEGELNISDLPKMEYEESRDWINFAAGYYKFMLDQGYKLSGFDILIYGNIPNGAGLSSSASLELLLGTVANIMFNQSSIPMVELIKLGKRTENEFIGVMTGIMDQFAIGMGKENKAVYLDTNTLEYSYQDVDLKDYVFVILNTNKRRELKDSKYNQRRGECEKALSILQTKYEIENLCQLSLDALENSKDLLSDKVIYDRAYHVISENNRVKEAIEAMGKGDIRRLGELLNQSHYSLRDYYEVTGPHLDSISDESRKLDYCLGARMTGAGFGGCGIAIVQKDKIEEFIETVKKAYKEKTGLDGGFYISGISDGPREV